MRLVTPDTIKISPNRQRQDFSPEAMQELINSITDVGLLHAPVIRFEGADMVLVAGERRLRAMQEMLALGDKIMYDSADLPPGMIPVVSLGELSPLEAEEAELDENLKRKDLTWQEHAAALQKLHNLRQALAAKYGQVHTVTQTALEVVGRSDGTFRDNVRKELVVANHLDNAAVASAKNVNEAFKILKKQETEQKNAELAHIVGATFTVDSHTILNQNCLPYMAEAGVNGKFDVILTDPPYGMDADDFGDGGGKQTNMDHQYDDSITSWRKLMTSWCALSYQVAKPQAHAYVFCDPDNFHELRSMMQLVGWYVFRTPLIAYKLNSGRVPLPTMGPRRQYETILYAIKGKKEVTHIYPDVIPCQGDENTGHGAQKPVALFQNLLQRSVKPGDSILDSFAGSGPLLEAAHQMQCYATLIEAQPQYYGLILNRAKALKTPNINLALELL